MSGEPSLKEFVSINLAVGFVVLVKARWAVAGVVAAGVGIAWAARNPDAAVEIAAKVALLFVVVVAGLIVLFGFVFLVGYVSMQNEWLREWVGETDVDELPGDRDA